VQVKRDKDFFNIPLGPQFYWFRETFRFHLSNFSEHWLAPVRRAQGQGQANSLL
jgi:hypothetical protein